MIGNLISLFTGARESNAVVKITDDQMHDAAFKQAVERISPRMVLLGRENGFPRGEREEMLIGIAELHAVTNYNSENWAAFWFKGKAYQALENHELAYREFKASYALEKENPDVAREYATSCLELGLGEEGFAAARHALGLRPNDAGLRANLALALLIAARIVEAKTEIEAALAMDPHDRISSSVARVIDEVLAGTRKQPKFMADLNR